MFSLPLAGCAWTPERCTGTDWYGQGYADGLRTSYSLYDRYGGYCAAFGIKPDPARYKQGFDDGVWYTEHKPCMC